MNKVEKLKQRLQAIGQSLQSNDNALALLGLGSAGAEQSRLDDYSDLDFFAIVKDGHKQHFVNNLFWLESIHPIAYCFQNTGDGYKLLYDDGIFCEFAVFEAHELEHIPFSPGAIIWACDSFDHQLVQPKNHNGHYQPSHDVQWLVGEAITNLYVGLSRYRRGEKLSALRFVEHYALDRIIDLNALNQQSTDGADLFVAERRLEQRQPEFATQLAGFCQGYNKVDLSALTQLRWLQTHYDVNPAMAKEIERLAKEKSK